MKSFLKYLLATIVGIIISSVLIFFIFFGIVGAIMSSQDKPLEIKENTMLVLKLDQPITDRAPASPFDYKRFSSDNRLGLNDILNNIQKAKEDPNINGIYIELSNVGAGLATTEEIRNALIDFRKSGKFVVSYCNNYFSQKALYLTSVSDKVFLNPVGLAMFTGLSFQTTHLKNTLQKLDVDATVIKIGEYKGAGELFEYDKMSGPNRLQLERIANTAWNNVISDIAEARSIDAKKLDELVNNLDITNPKEALKYGLVDSLIYKGDVINYLKSITGTELKDDLEAIKLSKYKKVAQPRKYKGLAKDKIAVIYATGGIVDGEGEVDNIGGARYARAIRTARRDSSIKAIVLRVNSGGGSAMASEDILVEVLETKGVKPIVVSMGDVAGSGGYYIACAADTVLAGRSTITGSIGVIGTFFNTEGFFNKLGISFDVAKSNEYADLLSGVKPVRKREKELIKSFISVTYDQFIAHVANGRGMTKEQVNEIGRGHIYSGVDAKDINLIDDFGGLTRAVEIAKNMAGLDEKYKIVELPKQPDPVEQLIKEISGDAKVKSMIDLLGINYNTYLEVRDIIQAQGIVARMPFVIEVD
jgi:protease-4